MAMKPSSLCDQTLAERWTPAKTFSTKVLLERKVERSDQDQRASELRILFVEEHRYEEDRDDHEDCASDPTYRITVMTDEGRDREREQQDAEQKQLEESVEHLNLHSREITY
jgi:hypothetical protein